MSTIANLYSDVKTLCQQWFYTKSEIDDSLRDMIDVIYPVGAIYMSTNSTSPQSLFGGTWERIEDKFLLASGTTYSNGATGGSATVTLSENQMPSHKHTAGKYDDAFELGNEGFASGNRSGVYINTNSSTSSARIHTNYTGGGQAHNNMPPYLAVYVWKRTA